MLLLVTVMDGAVTKEYSPQKLLERHTVSPSGGVVVKHCIKTSQLGYPVGEFESPANPGEGPFMA